MRSMLCPTMPWITRSPDFQELLELGALDVPLVCGEIVVLVHPVNPQTATGRDLGGVLALVLHPLAAVPAVPDLADLADLAEARMSADRWLHRPL
ncbi:hypothetical protein O7595_19645 [Streptomyces sp. WMMC940]|nr:hypothetical protein [Streptomyces sp. WMMC940]MCZ7459790.1 hypothetical protein [Streptomyces sp. WMMC940]